jgi:hypothetical protein
VRTFSSARRVWASKGGTIAGASHGAGPGERSIRQRALGAGARLGASGEVWWFECEAGRAGAGPQRHVGHEVSVSAGAGFGSACASGPQQASGSGAGVVTQQAQA